jgi:3-hydroxyacyl-CoA dehydrogenase
MPYGIDYVTVIGAGTMGAAIAGHLANAGIPRTLLDIVPTELTAEEQKAGLTLPTARCATASSKPAMTAWSRPTRQPLHQERGQPGQRRQPGR